MIRGAAFLILLAVFAAAVLTSMHELTGERIAENELEQRLAALHAVLPAGAYDNEPHRDVVYVTNPDLLGDDGPLPVYRARAGGVPVAAVVTTVAPNGFTGPIRVLVGVGVDGRVIAARVVAHRETPGLGDRIDPDKSDWMESFSNLQTEDPLAEEWIIDKDGGTFDHMTGATVTSLAVVNAVRNAVIYFNSNRQELFAAEAAE